MAQLNLQHDVVDSALLRDQIDKSIEEIEMMLPEGTAVSIHLRRESKSLFAANFRIRLFNKILVVTEEDSNLFQALNRAKKHLLRQINSIQKKHRDMKRDHRRNRHSRQPWMLPVAG